MKSATLILALIFSSTLVHAVEAPLTGGLEKKMVAAFGGYKMWCQPSGDNSFKVDFKRFPFSVSIETPDSNILQFTMQSWDQESGVGFGGEEITDLDMTQNWILVSVGDDGRNHYMLPNPATYPNLKKENPCKRNSDKTIDFEDASAMGSMLTAWDAGSMMASPLLCCFQSPN